VTGVGQQAARALLEALGVRTVTSALGGQGRDDPRTRAEFLGLATTMRG